jgi:VWFA-related protein
MKTLCVAVLLAAFASDAAAQGTASVEIVHATPAPAVRITSPLGRTGDSATVRIVAQVQRPPELATGAMRVKFFVDDTQVGTAESPPYAVTWVDENPFEPRKIKVEAEHESGAIGRDAITLPAFEIEEHTEVGRILVEAGVYDAGGRPALGLKTTDFRLREDGKLQELDVVAKEVYSMSVVLLVDNSQSVARRIAEIRSAAERFAQSLDRNDTVIVAPFNTKLGSITGPTKDVATIAESIEAMKAKGGTAILDAVAAAVRLLDGAEGRRVVVLVTDGFDENSTLTLDSVVKSAQTARVGIYGVAIGGINGVSLTGESALRQLTTRTGGQVFFPWRDVDLPVIAKRVAEDARNRYLMTYTPSNQKKDGTWRTISVEVPEGHKVVAREGYKAPSPPPIRPTLEFHVTNAEQGYVTLASTDFEVIEDGVVQKVDTFHEALEPVSIVLTLDSSGSMVKAAESVRETARQFVRAVRKEDRLALITFSDEPRFEHVLSTDRALTMGAIDKYTPAGGTALYDALWDSLLHLRKETGRRAIVLLTDGRDENNPGTAPGSVHTFNEVLTLAREVGATVFTVGLGVKLDNEVLEKLAARSGGQAYFSAGVEGLDAQFGSIVENLRQRYVVSYSSTNIDRNGEWRAVQIRPRAPGLVVTSMEGYFAPAE